MLLVDEPECGTSERVCAWIWRKLESLRGAQTIIVVTHDIERAGTMSDDLLFMLDGELVESGPTRALFSQPEKARTREMLRWGG